MNSKVVPIAVISIAVVLVLSVVILGSDNITGKAVGDVTYYCWGSSATDFTITTSATKPYSWYTQQSWTSNKCYTYLCSSWCSSKGFASGAVGSNTQQCVCSVASTPATCTDSDGGKVYGLKGTITGDKSGGTYTDSCSGNQLREYFCKQDGWAASEYYTCPSGQVCDSNLGACVVSSSPSTATYYCCGGSSTDFRITTTSNCDGVSYYTKKSWSSGYCFTPTYTCNSWCISKGYALASYSSDKLQCICSGTSPVATCTDSDGGVVYTTKGVAITTAAGGSTKTDTCGSSNAQAQNSVLEYYCTSEKTIVEMPSYNCATEGKTCVDGACVFPNCKDSDSGKNYSVKGTVTGDKSGGGPYTDACEGGQLREAYCSPDGWAASEYYTCQWDYYTSQWTAGYNDHSSPGRCEEGACVFCKDTDGGKNPAVKGTVTGAGNVKGISQFTDRCQSWGNLLAEYYCKSDERIALEYITCPPGQVCADDTCK